MSEVLEAPPPVTQPVTMTADQMIENFVKLRARKKEIEEAHKRELAPFNQMMEQLQGWMLEALNNAQLDSMKSPHGTAYKSLRTSAVVRDWPATLAFIKEHLAWDLLEARVSKLAAFSIMAEIKAPIPGVETSSEIIVNVRKAGEKTPANG